MTLLDASVTLIDAARQLPESKVLNQAIKRMEKRVDVLRLRGAKAQKRNRSKAWIEALVAVGVMNPKGKQGDRLDTRLLLFCEKCGFQFNFGSFCKNARINGRGEAKSLCCPDCAFPIIGETETEEEI